jgi:hypothetical protein
VSACNESFSAAASAHAAAVADVAAELVEVGELVVVVLDEPDPHPASASSSRDVSATPTAWVLGPRLSVVRIADSCLAGWQRQ